MAMSCPIWKGLMGVVKEGGIRFRAARILEVLISRGPLSAVELEREVPMRPKQLHEVLPWLLRRRYIVALPKKGPLRRRLFHVPDPDHDPPNERFFKGTRGTLSFTGTLTTRKIPRDWVRYPIVADFVLSKDFVGMDIDECVIGQAHHAGGTEPGETEWWWGSDPAELAIVYVDHAWDGDEAAFLEDLPRLIAHEVVHGLIYMALDEQEGHMHPDYALDHWATRAMGLSGSQGGATVSSGTPRAARRSRRGTGRSRREVAPEAHVGL